ncbi:Aldose-ketose isomerase YihS [Enterobacter hormaechei]|nr:Aldose-ketose isomerase YihS [Enterobacter hormaechei]
MKWFNTLSHNRWLEQETDRILDFGKKRRRTDRLWLAGQ